MSLRAFLPVVISLSLLAAAQDREQKQSTSVVSSAKEAALGAQLAKEVQRQSTPLGLLRVDNYVASLGLRMAAQMPNAQESWNFSVIRDHRIGSPNEPISLPGGWIFVSAELILAAHTEAEFAGLLAHAMAHVAERHGIRQTTDVNTLAAVPLIYLGTPAALRGGADNGSEPSAFLKIHNQFELDADRIAVKL